VALGGLTSILGKPCRVVSRCSSSLREFEAANRRGTGRRAGLNLRQRRAFAARAPARDPVAPARRPGPPQRPVPSQPHHAGRPRSAPGRNVVPAYRSEPGHCHNVPGDSGQHNRPSGLAIPSNCSWQRCVETRTTPVILSAVPLGCSRWRVAVWLIDACPRIGNWCWARTTLRSEEIQEVPRTVLTDQRGWMEDLRGSRLRPSPQAAAARLR
jgi:hypothetical protein